MKKALLIAAVIAALLPGTALAAAKEKEKKKPRSAPTPTTKEEAVVDRPEPGWTPVATNAPKLVKVSYKIDGKSLLIKFRNISTTTAARIKYHAKWKKDWHGRLVDDSTAEGLSLRLKKGDDLTQEIRTGAMNIKDVVITIDASETN